MYVFDVIIFFFPGQRRIRNCATKNWNTIGSHFSIFNLETDFFISNYHILKLYFYTSLHKFV